MPQKISRRTWIALFLILCMAAAFIIRALPAFFISDSGFLYTYDTDTWYTLRQVELMVSHYPQYAWFDPMTAYPSGKDISWGPLFPFIAASLCLIAGATGQGQIIYLTEWISPVLAVLLVPVIYFLGKTVRDEWTGIVAAGLAAVISFRFYFFSMYGYADHHIMEIFFSTLFLLVFLYFIDRSGKTPADWHSGSGVKIPLVLALLGGLLYFCALITSTTVLLVVPVIAVYTVIQMVLDFRRDHEPASLLFFNGISFSVTGVLLVIFGLDWAGFSFTGYSLGLLVIVLSVVAETALLWVLARVFKGKTLLYGAGILVVALCAAILVMVNPLFRAIGMTAGELLSGSSAYSTVVQETLPWSFQTAWANFNIAIVLSVIGLCILGYRAMGKREPVSSLFLVWSLVMLFATVLFRRFEYYSTINILILAAICITEPFLLAGDAWKQFVHSVTSGLQRETMSGTRVRGSSQEDPEGSGSKARHKKRDKSRRTGRRDAPVPAMLALCLLMILLTVATVTISTLQDYDYAVTTPSRQISDDWIGALAYLQQNTPSPGVDYYQKYDRASFSYPASSYGIMSSWGAGHWITFFSHRIPITNPFQDNLAGKSGAAAFFLDGDESSADAILGSFGGKYIVTDSDTAVDTFSSLIPWADNSTDVSPYIKWFLVPSEADPSALVVRDEYDNGYFQTMVVRLQNFDGSLTLPDAVDYIQYTVRQVPASGESAEISGQAPVITREVSLNASVAEEEVGAFNAKGGDVQAIVLSGMPDKPVRPVPALQHYRLIYESPGNATVTTAPGSAPVTLPGIKSVKVFQYVPGAQIPGTGTIEVPVRTNTGRVFVYRQESINGTFIVPYPTSPSLTGVGATGPYHILGTDRFINVTEDSVLQGSSIPG